jgi:membrane protease subunit HflK
MKNEMKSEIRSENEEKLVGGAEVGPLEATVHLFMRLLKVFMALICLGYVFSGVSLVNPDEVAIIKRLGKLVGEGVAEQVHQPGWLFALPRPFDEVIRVPVKQVRQVRVLELSAKELADGEMARNTIDPEGEGYCISGDENICQMRVLVKYKISDPVKAALEAWDELCCYDDLVKEFAVAELTKGAGMFSIDGLLTSDKFDFAQRVKEKTQLAIERADFGIEVLEVELEELTPPNYLKEAFEIVNSAYVDRRNFISNANGINEEKVPRAKSDAETMITEANAYAEAKVAQAEGEAGQFLKLLKVYNENPQEVRVHALEATRKKVLSRLSGLVVFPAEKHSGAAVRTIINSGGASVHNEDLSSVPPTMSFSGFDRDFSELGISPQYGDYQDDH